MLMASLEVKGKTREVALGLGAVPKGAPKVVGASEQGKGVERSLCNHCTVASAKTPGPGMSFHISISLLHDCILM